MENNILVTHIAELKKDIVNEINELISLGNRAGEFEISTVEEKLLNDKMNLETLITLEVGIQPILNRYKDIVNIEYYEYENCTKSEYSDIYKTVSEYTVTSEFGSVTLASEVLVSNARNGLTVMIREYEYLADLITKIENLCKDTIEELNIRTKFKIDISSCKDDIDGTIKLLHNKGFRWASAMLHNVDEFKLSIDDDQILHLNIMRGVPLPHISKEPIVGMTDNLNVIHYNINRTEEVFELNNVLIHIYSYSLIHVSTFNVTSNTDVVKTACGEYITFRTWYNELSGDVQARTYKNI